MKSLSENYAASHSSTHETFADLVFCALVVLVLFVFTLAVEVSQRVRADIVSKEAVPEVESIENIETLSPEEVRELSEKLQKQQKELESQRQRMLAQETELQDYRQRIASEEAVVANKVAALNGEQRFTGATEPSDLTLAYEYYKDRYIFIRKKEFNHAVTRQSGESTLAFAVRSREEQVALALKARKQRSYTEAEMMSLYVAFSQYRQINPTDSSYDLSTERMGISYGTTLSGYIAGDVDLPGYASEEVENAVQRVYLKNGPASEAMYPSVTVEVLGNQRSVVINGVELTAKDFKDMLLAIGGRGVMLDFKGYDGPAPKWLVDQVLTPTGYIGKTPKMPGT
jgi:hypothetical protein